MYLSKKHLENTIFRYCTAWDLLNDFGGYNIMDLPDAVKDMLKCVDDFEGFSYYVISGKQVLIVDGDADGVGTIINKCTIKQFIEQSIEYARENMEV